ncbi:MAG: hypothetical protein BWY54_00509 [Candidatus Dependentiae bacterium ADurb.Bin331]|nr:MAG: hypothetical protein BWY54_00509 [Candidatus Dependentiae bacterium ADurb.Bin331]
MNDILNAQQQKIWEQEHAMPNVLVQMDSPLPSAGVVKFFQWLNDNNINRSTGLEMGCGKGRNVIWLAQKKINMVGFDFSPTAIERARLRSVENNVEEKTHFIIHDATQTWPFEANHFDFVIDCFATTDIAVSTGRIFAISEMMRILKPNGFILVYVMSTQDMYHKKMIAQSPAHEQYSFFHPHNGKFEKVFTGDEIKMLYKDAKLIIHDRIAKIATFFGEDYECNHHWMIFQKNNS